MPMSYEAGVNRHEKEGISGTLLDLTAVSKSGRAFLAVVLRPPASGVWRDAVVQERAPASVNIGVVEVFDSSEVVVVRLETASGVRCGQGCYQTGRLPGEARPQRSRSRVVDGAFDLASCRRRPPGQPLGDETRSMSDLGTCGDVVHKSQMMSFGSIDPTSVQEKFQRPARAEHPNESLGASGAGQYGKRRFR